MARQSKRRESVQPIEGEALWERIDSATRRAGKKTSDLARAAGVTWAAAKRWRMPPHVERGKSGSEPGLEHLYAIAKELGVTVDELRGLIDEYNPPGEAWARFLETEEGRSASEAELRALRSIIWPPDVEPTVLRYRMQLQTLR